MGNTFCERGSDIFVRVGDVSFKSKVYSIDRLTGRIEIEVPLQWLFSLAAAQKDDECTIICKPDKGQNYLVGLTRVVNKRFNISPPLLVIDIPEKIEERKELRRYKRIGVSIFTGISHREELIDGFLIKRPLTGTVVDISQGGCLILADYHFKIGEFLDLDLNISESENLRIRCQVRNSRPFYESRLNLYGLEFVNMENGAKEKLENFIATIV